MCKAESGDRLFFGLPFVNGLEVEGKKERRETSGHTHHNDTKHDKRNTNDTTLQHTTETHNASVCQLPLKGELSIHMMNFAHTPKHTHPYS